jgi:triosephosphate isomerase
MRRKLIAGNWKMNGMQADMAQAMALAKGLSTKTANCDVMLCPPATLILSMADKLSPTMVSVGAQDCHVETSGAFTGDVSAEMLKDAGATAVIVGHSERRAGYHESSSLVKQKAEAAWRAGMMAIICVGETQRERESGVALNVVSQQVRGSLPVGATAANTVIAYEPVWAIGTGLTPTLEDIAQVHAQIREDLKELTGNEAEGLRVLYGGSVKPSNAKEILAVENVDGALVGGASLKADDFLGIISAV